MLRRCGRWPEGSREGDRRELHQAGPGSGRAGGRSCASEGAGGQRQAGGTAGDGGTAGAAEAGVDGGTTEALTQDMLVKSLSGAGASAREAVGVARRGVSTVIEKIDPGTLAELIIKATALQEMTNRVAAPEGLALPDRGDLDLGVDPAGGHLRDPAPGR